jgi:hypothetical protein
MTIEITKGSDNPITDFFSSQSNTPETDAATHDLSDYGPPVPCSWGDWVAADYARKLERERDEARKESEEQARLLGMSAEREESLRGKLFMLERELAKLKEGKH